MEKLTAKLTLANAKKSHKGVGWPSTLHDEIRLNTLNRPLVSTRSAIKNTKHMPHIFPCLFAIETHGC